MAFKKKKYEDKTSFPMFILTFYTLAWLVIVGCGLYRIPFGGPITKDDFVFAVLVVISWIATVFLAPIGIALAKFQNRRHNQLDRVSQCKNLLLVSIGSCAFFAFLPRVVVFFDREWIMWYSIYVSYFGITVFMFVYGTMLDPVCKIKRSWLDGPSWMLLSVHAIFLLALIKYLDNNCSIAFGHRTAIFLCHLGFSFACAVTTIDFCYVWRGEIRMNLNPAKEDVESFGLPAIPADGMQSEEFESTFKCEVCNKNYNQISQTPRMLKECGHTVCEECGDELLEKNKEKFLECPYCETITLVNGPAALLPKNAVIMDTMGPKNVKNPVEVV